MSSAKALSIRQDVAVIVVNYNAGDYLNRCLDAIYSANQVPAKVLVVDNASQDDSLAKAQAVFPQVEFYAQSENLGFAAANNLGAKQVENFEWLALINPDAFVEPDWLDHLSSPLAIDSQVDFISCQLLSDKNINQLDGAGDCYHVSGLIWRRLHGANKAAVSVLPFFAPCAAAALYRRAAFMQVGGFDEQYFCYSEDIDLGFRLRLSGFKGEHVNQSKVRHVGSGITGIESDFSIYHGHRNLVWTYFKNMPRALFWRYLPQHLLMNVVSIVYYLLKGRGVILKAKWHAIKALPRLLREKRQGATDEQNQAVNIDRIQPHLATGWLTAYIGRGR